MKVIIGSEVFNAVETIKWLPQDGCFRLTYEHGEIIKVKQEALYIGEVAAVNYIAIPYELRTFKPMNPVEIREFGKVGPEHIPYCGLIYKTDCASKICTGIEIRNVTSDEIKLYDEMTLLGCLYNVLETNIYRNSKEYSADVIDKMSDSLIRLKQLTEDK